MSAIGPPWPREVSWLGATPTGGSAGTWGDTGTDHVRHLRPGSGKRSAPMVSLAGGPQPGRARVNCAVLFFRGCRAARRPDRPRGPRDDLLIKAGGRGQPERVHHVRGTAYFWPVPGGPDLCQPRTRADGEACYGEQSESSRARANTRLFGAVGRG